MMIPRAYFQEEDLSRLGRELIGKSIFTRIGGQISGGVIIEVETSAFSFVTPGIFPDLPAVKETGILHVHGDEEKATVDLLTGKKENPAIIRIRAFVPTHGDELILYRVGKTRIENEITLGPERVAKALGITSEHNRLEIPSAQVWLEDRNIVIPEPDIVITQLTDDPDQEENDLFTPRFLTRYRYKGSRLW